MSATNVGAGGRSYLDVLGEFYEAELRYVAAGGAQAGADFSEMAACLHPAVVARQGPTLPYGGDWHGIDGARQFFAVFTDTWSTLELSETRVFEGDTGIAITQRMVATAHATGRRVDTLVSHFLTFEDGLIRDFTVLYLDPVGVRDATAGFDVQNPASGVLGRSHAS